MVRLVDNQGPEGFECARGERPLAQSLNHGNDKVVSYAKFILLDSSYSCARAKLLDPLDPLIGQESFVDYDEGPTFELGSECQGANGLSKPYIEGQNAIPYFCSFSDSLDLMLSQIASKTNIGRGALGSRWRNDSVLVKSGYSNRAFL
jgi:hypothetical protein